MYNDIEVKTMTTNVRYVIEEGQISRLFHDRPEDALDYAVAGPLKVLQFLGFTNESTGGNCEAMRIDFENGLFALVSDNSQEPNDEWNTLDAAIYDGEGGEFDVNCYMCDADEDETRTAEVERFAEDMVAFANRAELAKGAS